MRVHDTASLLGPAARGAVRVLMEIALATPKQVYISAGVAALVVGIGANVVLLQIARHPAPLLASVAHDPLPASASTAAPAGTVEPVAADLGVQHSLGRCAPCGGRIARYPSVGA